MPFDWNNADEAKAKREAKHEAKAARPPRSKIVIALVILGLAIVLFYLWASYDSLTETSGPSGPGTFGLPTSGIDEGTGMAAEITGTLEGDVATSCLWLQLVDPIEGAIDGRLSIVWPKGFSGRTDPLRVYGPSGELVATVGDTVHVGGGITPETGDRCQVSPATWLASEIISSP